MMFSPRVQLAVDRCSDRLGNEKRTEIVFYAAHHLPIIGEDNLVNLLDTVNYE